MAGLEISFTCLLKPPPKRDTCKAKWKVAESESEEKTYRSPDLLGSITTGRCVKGARERDRSHPSPCLTKAGQEGPLVCSSVKCTMRQGRVCVCVGGLSLG